MRYFESLSRKDGGLHVPMKTNCRRIVKPDGGVIAILYVDVVYTFAG